MSLKSKILLNSIFGAIGGFAGWVLITLLMRGFFSVPLDEHQPGETVRANIQFGLLAGLTIGGMLGAADALWSGSGRISRRAMIVGCVVGAFGGVLGLSMGQSVYTLLAPPPPTADVPPFGWFILDVFGKAVGWAIIGVILGAAQGVSMLSVARAKHGAIGGAIGGFIGGMSFNITAFTLQSDTLSRLISLALTGFAIGLMIGLIQDLLKPAWIVILRDNNEGREIPVNKPLMTIGRDELADIPIFTDQTVGPRHAVLRQENRRYVLEDSGSGLGTSVNGQNVASRILKDRDNIQIGTVKLLFREKATASRHVAPAEAPVSVGTARIPTSAHLCPFCGGIKDANGSCGCSITTAPLAPDNPPPPRVGKDWENMPPPRVGEGWGGVPGRLVAMQGPHASSAWDVKAGETTIGREEGRDVCLQNDGAVSRRHARITREESGFVIYDEGSSNGTFVNGARVTRAILSPGDMITVGATELKFKS